MNLVTRGSGNIFRDLGLPDSTNLEIKAGLVLRISRIIERRRLTQVQAARILGIDQPKSIDAFARPLRRVFDRKNFAIPDGARPGRQDYDSAEAARDRRSASRLIFFKKRKGRRFCRRPLPIAKIDLQLHAA